MKRLITLSLLLLSAFNVKADGSLSPYDLGRPIGWATVEGQTTGSNDENAVVVSSLSELNAALKTARDNIKKDAGYKMTVYVKGEIEASSVIYLQDSKNITIYGLPGSALINKNRDTKSSTGILVIKRCENIIMRNMTFKSAGAYDIDGNDNLTLQSSKHIWIDHCDFQDGVDGNFDCNSQSNNICVSWCRFRYLISPKAGGSGGSNDHRFSNLWGGSDSADDDGYLNTTFVCCWWDEGCRERMPRIRFGRIHILNCLYSSSVTSYAVGIGYKARAYVENSIFDFTINSSHKVWKYASTSGQDDHSFIFKGCQGISDTKDQKQEDYFIPSETYAYEAFDANLVKEAISNEETGAGATLDIKEGEPFTTGIANSDDKLITRKTVYHNVSGKQVSPLTKGVIIRTDIMSDGTRRVRKIIR